MAADKLQKKEQQGKCKPYILRRTLCKQEVNPPISSDRLETEHRQSWQERLEEVPKLDSNSTASTGTTCSLIPVFSCDAQRKRFNLIKYHCLAHFKRVHRGSYKI